MTAKEMTIRSLIIEEDVPITAALEQLSTTGKRVLFVERDSKLAAALSDGDIRRWLLSKGSLDAPVNQVANYNPLFLYVEDKHRSVEFMKKHHIGAVPILDHEHRIVDMSYIFDLESNDVDLIDLPVVIMAGGLGTRLYPYTKILPKPLIPIGDVPIIEHIINRFRKYGCREFYLIVNYKKNMIKAYFNEIEKDYTVHYVDEDVPLGTGGGLSLLKGKLNSTFILTNCDILIEEDYAKMLRLHRENKNKVTMICSLKNFTIPYGIVEIGDNGSILEMREKPNMSFFTNTGMYFVEPEVVEGLNEGESIGFPDVVERHRVAGENVGVYPISEHAWMDMGQFDQMEEMRKRLEGR